MLERQSRSVSGWWIVKCLHQGGNQREGGTQGWWGGSSEEKWLFLPKHKDCAGAWTRARQLLSYIAWCKLKRWADDFLKPLSCPDSQRTKRVLTAQWTCSGSPSIPGDKQTLPAPQVTRTGPLFCSQRHPTSRSQVCVCVWERERDRRRSYSQKGGNDRKSCHMLDTNLLGTIQVHPSLPISELRVGDGQSGGARIHDCLLQSTLPSHTRCSLETLSDSFCKEQFSDVHSPFSLPPLRATHSQYLDQNAPSLS